MVIEEIKEKKEEEYWNAWRDKENEKTMSIEKLEKD